MNRTPLLEEKLPPITHVYDDVTKEGITKIIDDAIKYADKTTKRIKRLDPMDKAIVQRQRNAIMATIEAIRDKYDLRNPSNGIESSTFHWARLCTLIFTDLNVLDDDKCILVAAAIWILDHIDQNDIEELLEEVNDNELDDIYLPFEHDSTHSIPAIEYVTRILQDRNIARPEHNFDEPLIGKDCIRAVATHRKGKPATRQHSNDNAPAKDDVQTAGAVDTSTSVCRDIYESLIGLIPQRYITHARTQFRHYFWLWVDRLFELDAILCRDIGKALAYINGLIEEHNRCVDEYVKCTKELEIVARGKTTAKARNQLQNGTKAGSPVRSISPLLNSSSGARAPHTITPEDFLRQMGEAQQIRGSISPLNKPFAVEMASSPIMSIKDSLDRLHDIKERINAHINDIDAPVNKAMSFLLECGFHGITSPDLCREDPGIDFDHFQVPDPYEMCAGLLFLIEDDDDLVWLGGAIHGFMQNVAYQLPWSVIHHTKHDYTPSTAKPLPHTDLFALKYRDKTAEPSFQFPRNMSHILYERTGTLPPRRLDKRDDYQLDLKHYGLKGAELSTATAYIQLLTDMRMQTGEFLEYPVSTGDSDESVSIDTIEDIVALRSNVAELRGQLTDLRKQIKSLHSDLHNEARLARNAEKALEEEKEQIRLDRQELASLREILFHQDAGDAVDTSTGAILPDGGSSTVERRTVVFGGHDTWLKPMKTMITGDVRFVGRDLGFDTDIIKNADVIWIQTNSMSHKQYYRIIDAVRKYGKDVKYFLYASARKCAEQLMLAERE